MSSKPGRITRAWLSVLKHTLNPLTLRLARSGHGPISLIRHVGRTSGATYETPLIIARVPDGFIAELTYGPQVAWYRNVRKAGHAVVLYKGREYAIDRIEPYPTDAGRRAYGPPFAQVLALLRRKEFRLLHTADPAGPPSPDA